MIEKDGISISWTTENARTGKIRYIYTLFLIIRLLITIHLFHIFIVYIDLTHEIYISLNISFNIHITFIIELYISILNFKLTDYAYTKEALYSIIDAVEIHYCRVKRHTHKLQTISK